MEAQWSDKLQMGDITLNNRVVMAALTRERCDVDLCIPTPLLQQYYSQRAGAGFILTEATAWSLRGRGFVGAACLYNKDQMEGWKKVNDAVHAKGGKIFLQIFHCGRVCIPEWNNSLQVWGPSAIRVREPIRGVPGVSYSLPKQMTLQDIQVTKQEFQQSLKYALQAGFDGIQLHGGHGYLIHSFLASCSNHRTDQYGGSVENRIKFCLELTDIALKHFPPSRIGIKLTPVSRLKDMYDENPVQTFSALLKELDKRKIGFVELRQSTELYPLPQLYPKTQKEQIEDVCKTFRPFYSGLLVGNDSFNGESGLAKIRGGLCDAISFGRLYISNPDLAERLTHGWQVNTKYDMKTFFRTPDSPQSGYTDYPFYKPQ